MFQKIMSTGTGDFKQLYYASRDGDIENVKYFCRGADLNFLHPEFLTAPLHESIRNGHLEVSRYLLEQGADPNLREGYSIATPMSIAVAANDQAAIALLKEKGAYVESRSWQKLWTRFSNFLYDRFVSI